MPGADKGIGLPGPDKAYAHPYGGVFLFSDCNHRGFMHLHNLGGMHDRNAVCTVSLILQFLTNRRFVANKYYVYIITFIDGFNRSFNIHQRSVVASHSVKNNPHGYFSTTSSTLLPLYEPQLPHA